MNKDNPRRVLNKTMIFQLIILVVVVVLTATFTYSLTSKLYLDQQKSQNEQIRSLQNSIRRSNGLTELKEI